MPTNENHVRLVFDDTEYADLKRAAAIEGYRNLRSWLVATLNSAARRVISDFRNPIKPAEGGEPCAPS